MSSATITIVIVIVVIAVVAIAGGLMIARKKQSERLRERFGPEYDRAMENADSQREAESELKERTKRHKKLELRALGADERADFERRWKDVQGEFVDDPSRAVHNADRLVVDVMSARGYPTDDFDQRADDLSVDHPEVTQRYREARRVSKANAEGHADTEQLRKAVANYRDLVQALLTEGGTDRHDDTGRDGRHRDADHRDADRDADRRDADRPRADMGRGDHDHDPADGHTNGHVRSGHDDDVRTSERETERETRA
jgi:uncharacterized protein YneF (UPF0154 family)